MINPLNCKNFLKSNKYWFMEGQVTKRIYDLLVFCNFLYTYFRFLNKKNTYFVSRSSSPVWCFFKAHKMILIALVFYEFSINSNFFFQHVSACFWFILVVDVLDFYSAVCKLSQCREGFSFFGKSSLLFQKGTV